MGCCWPPSTSRWRPAQALAANVRSTTPGMLLKSQIAVRTRRPGQHGRVIENEAEVLLSKLANYPALSKSWCRRCEPAQKVFKKSSTAATHTPAQLSV